MEDSVPNFNQASLMTDSSSYKTAWYSRMSIRSVAVAAFLLPLAVSSLVKLRMHNDVVGWLPDDDLQAEILAWYQETFPEDESVLVSWDDCTVTDPRILQLKRRLTGVTRNEAREGGSPYISRVTTPADVLQKMTTGTDDLEASLQQTVGLLTGNGPLCVELSETGRRFSVNLTRAAKIAVRKQFGVELHEVNRTLAVPSAELIPADDAKAVGIHDSLKFWQSELPTADLQFTWEDMNLNQRQTELITECIEAIPLAADESGKPVVRTWFVPGSVAAVSVSLTPQGMLEPESAVAAIREAAVQCGIAPENLRLGGSTIAGTSVNAAVRSASWNTEAPVWKLWQRSPMALAAIAGFVCSWLTLRSLKLAILVQGVSILTAVLATALIVPTGGTMNMVLIVMPTLLLVISVSGAIHLCNYWKKAPGKTAEESVRYAIAQAWVPCVLAAGTTAIGLASLLVSNLVPVRDFGTYSFAGCLISVACVLLLLPAALLHSKAPASKSHSTGEAVFRRLAQLVTQRPTFHIVTSLAVIVVAAWGLQWFRTETKAIRYFPDDSRIVADYEFLERNLAGIVPVDTIVRFSASQQNSTKFPQRAAAVAKLQQALEQHEEVSGSLSLATFLPQNIRQMNLMQRKIKNAADNNESGKSGAASLLTYAKTDVRVSGQSDQFLQREGDEIWRISCQSSILSDCDYRVLTTQLNEIAENSFRDFPDGSPETLVTGLVPVFMRTQEALLESLVSSFGLAVLLIAGVMSVLLRSIPAALLAMIPNVAPVILIFGLLCWAGVHVDTGTMITASIALGLAVDGTLHLIKCFRMELIRGLDRQEAATEALVHCGPALMQTSIVVGLGMLTLSPVELLLISRFGWVMAALVAAAFWGDYIVLPALLAGPLGKLLTVSSEAAADEPHAEPNTLLTPASVELKAPHFLAAKHADTQLVDLVSQDEN